MAASDESSEAIMKLAVSVVLLVASMFPAVEALAARRKVVRGPRVHVTVRTGFPIRRTLPHVVVRPAPAVHAVPRVYLAPIVFGAVVVASLPPARVWSDDEELEREDGWTDFTMNVDRRGSRLFMQIEEGAVQISFAEIVFENGESQVVDFNDRIQRKGVYSLLDFKDGRQVDHVRVVAKAANQSAEITLHLVS